MYQWIELEEYMRKIMSFVLVCLLLVLRSLKCQKWLISCISCWLHFCFANLVVFLILSPSKGNLTSKYINHTIFWKNSIRCFRCTYIFCPKCDYFFAFISSKHKNEPFLTFLWPTKDPFFSSTLWTLSVDIFHFFVF